jgi:hypothetical protein
MAKQNPSSPVDEQYLMSVIAGGFSTKKETSEPVTLQPKEPEEKHAADEAAAPGEKTNVGEKPREPAKRKLCNAAGYETVFLQHGELKARQSVYISKEIHEKVSKIVSVLGGKELSVGGYIDNVLSQHFETYMNEINELYEKKYTKLF